MPCCKQEWFETACGCTLCCAAIPNWRLLAACGSLRQHLCLPAAVAWLPPTSRSRPHCSCSHPQRRLQCLHNRHGQVHQWRAVRAVRGGIPPWPSRLVPQGLRGCRGEKLALQTADGAPLVECPRQLPATFHPIHVAQLNPPCPSSDAVCFAVMHLFFPLPVAAGSLFSTHFRHVAATLSLGRASPFLPTMLPLVQQL